jgi:hypothetical protein
MIPTAPQQYAFSDQQAMRAEIKRELDRRVVKNADFEPEPGRIILRSPDGTRYALVVADGGALSTVSL